MSYNFVFLSIFINQQANPCIFLVQKIASYDTISKLLVVDDIS